MNYIFENGEKLFIKEQSENPISMMEKITNQKLYLYQKQMLEQMFKFKKSDFNIYGDDFRIEFGINNIVDDCIIRITDYDENQNKEAEISISFNDLELNQLINILVDIKEKRNKLKSI